MDAKQDTGDQIVIEYAAVKENHAMLMETALLVATDDGVLDAQKIATAIMELIVMMLVNVLWDVIQHTGENLATSPVYVKMEKVVMIAQGPVLMDA